MFTETQSTSICSSPLIDLNVGLTLSYMDLMSIIVIDILRLSLNCFLFMNCNERFDQ